MSTRNNYMSCKNIKGESRLNQIYFYEQDLTHGRDVNNKL